MKKVLILGSSGMLGSMVYGYLKDNSNFDLYETNRLEVKNEKSFKLDAEEPDFSKFEHINFNYIINCIGQIKPLINDNDHESVLKAIKINTNFPHILNIKFNNGKTKIIQIATDCVYSGGKGNYSENDPHDALDVYGKTKSLGEISANNFINIRCSIIGPEQRGKISLLEWFLKQPDQCELNGYVNHLWNGITTLHFAMLIRTIIEKNIHINKSFNFIPKGFVTKYDMLCYFSKYYKKDHKIVKTVANPGIDRTLSCKDIEFNNMLWKEMNFYRAPTVEEMIKELSEYSDHSGLNK